MMETEQKVTRPKLPILRQFRTLLIGIFVALAVLPLSFIAYALINQATIQSEEQAFQQLNSVAELKSDQIDQFMQDADSAIEIMLADPQRRANMLRALTLEGRADTTLIDSLDTFFQESVASHASLRHLILYDTDGTVIATNEESLRAASYTDAPFFETSLLVEDLTAPLFYNEEQQDVELVITHRLIDGSDQTAGAIAAELEINRLVVLLSERTGLGETGETYIVDSESRLIGGSRAPELLFEEIESSAITDVLTNHREGSGVYSNYQGTEVLGVYRWIPQLGAGFLVEISKAEIDSTAQASRQSGIQIAVLIALGAALLAVIVASVTTSPIVEMTDAATDMAAGNLSRRVNINRDNEIGLLGDAFNLMAERMQGLILGLEGRVRERTRELEIAAEVARDISSSVSLDDLLRRVVDLTKASFNLYHVHIYMLDETADILRMEAGSGEPGRIMKEMGHSIQRTAERSLVARAARIGHYVIVNNVVGEPGHLPNPLLPDTRSEIALPLKLAGEVIGVLDLQASRVDRFRDEDARVLSTLADQIAVAVQNARLFEQTGRSERLLRSVIDASTDWIWAKDVNHRWILVNRAFSEQALGAEPDDVIGRTAGDYTTTLADGTPGASRMDEQYALQGRTIRSSEAPVMFVDGSEHYLDTVQSPLYDDRGNIVGTLGVSRDVTEARLARQRQATAYELGERLSSLLDVTALLSETITRLVQTFNYYHAHIYLLDEGGQLLVVQEGWGDAGATLKALGHSIPIDAERSLVARAARSRLPVTVNDVTDDPSHLPNPLLPDTRSETALPIFTGDTMIGVLDVQHNRASHFDEDEVRTLQIITSQLAVALSNARLFEDAQSALSETATLYAASEQITRATTLEEVLQGLVAASPLGQFERATISLFDRPWTDERPSTLIAAAVWEGGRTPRIPAGTTYPLAEMPIFNSMSRSQATIYNDVATDPRVDIYTRALFHDRLHMNALAAFPLVVGSSWIGIITGQSTDSTHLDEKQIRFVEALVSQAAAVTQNLRLYQEVQSALTQSRATQQLLTSVINTTPDWIWVKDRERRYVLANDALAHNFGLNPNQLNGKTDSELGLPSVLVEGDPERQISGTRNDDSSALFGKPVTNLNELFITKDGVEFLLETKRLPLYDEKRNVVGTLGIATDVTERRRQERRERLAYELGQSMAVLYSPDLLLRQTINLLAESLGYYHAHVYRMNEQSSMLDLAEGLGEAGELLKSMGHAIPLNAERSLVARAGRSLEPVVVNDVTVTPDHLPNPLLPETLAEVAVPLFSGQRLLGVLDIQHNIRDFFTEAEVRTLRVVANQLATALSNAELYQEQLENAERLRELDRLKSEFLANMSHELRTPLNSVIGYSELLIDEVGQQLDQMAFEDLKAIHSSGQHLLAIINDILDLAKIEAGRLELNKTALDLRTIAEALADQARVLLKDKPTVKLELVLAQDLPVIQADTVRIRQILWNLLSNATKFTDEGQIVLSAEVLSGEIQIAISDTGPGIEPRFHDIIFDQFRQADGSATRKKGGTGLGLAITRQLVMLHGGRIWLESAEGEGSTFYFTLPINARSQSHVEEQPLAATGD